MQWHFTNRWSIVQNQVMDLEQLTPLSICRSDGSDMDLSWFIRYFSNCRWLFGPRSGLYFVSGENVWKRLSAQDIRMQQNQIFVGLDQFISHLLFKSMLSILTKTSLCIKYHCYLFKWEVDALWTRICYN